ncbi:MAG: Ig-like domain-containing protein [Prevotella sp.]|nr:Ig-like domain-containing protein [Prevotella sp.]
MNVFVGDVAVSTQTKGCQETNTYFIDNNYQDAGNVYKLKVVSAHNAQVTKIQIYKKGTSQPIDPTVTLTTNNIKVGETTSINTSPNLSVSYTSDAPGVATVNNAGEITGVSAGEAKIKATWVADNNYNAGSKEFTVTVSKYDAEVTLSTTSIKVGKTATISYPEDLTSILFGSDNESVATVNEDGVITGVSAGEATITAIWGDNKYNDGETEFTIIVAEANVGVAFVKVTNLNQVVAGNQYVLVTESGIAMGAQNGNFRDNVEIDLDGNVAYVNNDVAVLTLGGKAGAWTFSPSDTSGELSFISDENNQLVTKTNATDAQKLWRISNDFQVWHRAFSGRTIQTDTHFGCYKNTQTPSYLYVKQGSAIDENYKKDPVFSIANATIELNSNAKRLKVNTPSDGAITFTNITIATITSNGDGSYLAEALEEGEATVTATLEATDEYEGDETTFTVTVVPEHSNIASHLYKKVTSTSDITAGKYLIVYEVGSLAFDGSLTTLDAPSNTISVNITDDNKIFCDEDVYFLIDPEAGTIRSASGYYIGVTSNSNGLKQSKVANAYKNDFSIEDGNAVIFANFTSSTMYLRYNTGSGQERFRYFKNAGQQAIQLYKAVDPFSFSIKEIAYDGVDHYATISALGSEPYYEVSGGVEVFTLSVDQHKLVFSAPFTDGDVIPTKDASDKDVAYLVRGDVGDYQFTAAATPEKLVTLGENLLVSSGENGVTAEEMAKAPYENGYVFYKLSIHPRTKKAGFLWGAENGAAFDYTTGHQAYLAVPSGKLTTQSVSGYYFDGTTGIEELTLPQVVNDSPAYTLSGIRMTGKNLPKGVYVVNGKKVIIK